MDQSLQENYINDNQTFNFIEGFFKNLGFSSILRSLGFYKQTGVPVLRVFQTIFTLIFTYKNWWRTCKDSNNDEDLKKDVVYRFLNHEYYKWEQLLLTLSIKVIIMFKKLTGIKRKCALIFDDTFFDRMRSKKVELLSWTFDHVDMKNKKGFLNLTGGWTDGFSFIPFIFQLVCSSKRKNILEEAKCVKKGSVADTRRKKAKQKKTELLIEMVGDALCNKIPFSIVLFDSWFSFPSIFIQLYQMRVKAIAMLKDHPKIFYYYRGKTYRLSVLYSKIKNRLKKDRDRLSVIVKIKSMGITIDAKILFIRDKRAKKNWLAILSTNIELADDEIIRLYGMRWDIEVFFKMCKSYLKFAKEFQGRSYDMLVAHTTIVYVRYIMFAFSSRLANDERSFGDFFYECCDEVKAISFLEAFQLILKLLLQFLKKKFLLAEQEVNQILDEFMTSLPPFLFQNLVKKKCES